MHKGIDQKFVHYGIRREDLALIAAICEKNEIDFDWMSENYEIAFDWMSENILRAYHGKRVDVIEMSDADTESIIKTAIQKIR